MLLSSGIHVFFLLPSLSLNTLLLQQQQEIMKKLEQIPRNKPEQLVFRQHFSAQVVTYVFSTQHLGHKASG